MWGADRDLATTSLNIALMVEGAAIIVGAFLKANVGFAVLAFGTFGVDKAAAFAGAALA